MSIYVRAIFAFPSFLYIVGPLSKLAYTHVLYIFLLLKATQIRLFAFCVVLIQSIAIFKKKKGGYILKIITKLYFTRNDDTISFCYKSLIIILVVMMMIRRRMRGTVMIIWNILGCY